MALWALGQGVSIVNDVWGLQREPNMARVVAEHGVPVVVMHNRYKADPAINIMSDINAFFSYSLDIAEKAGIARESIVLDPGIGFGKTPEQSMEAIAQLDDLQAVRPADPGRRLAQALHRTRVAVGADGAARRLDRGPCDGLSERRRHHPHP